MYLRFAPPVFFMFTCSVLLLSRSIRTSPWLNLIHQFNFIHRPSVQVYIFVLSVRSARSIGQHGHRSSLVWTLLLLSGLCCYSK
jgi:hypothetical protein